MKFRFIDIFCLEDFQCLPNSFDTGGDNTIRNGTGMFP